MDTHSHQEFRGVMIIIANPNDESQDARQPKWVARGVIYIVCQLVRNQPFRTSWPASHVNYKQQHKNCIIQKRWK